MPRLESPVRPAYRPYEVEVVAVRRLTPHFVRVTFAGDDLEHFGTAGLDQRIKLVLPLASIPGGFADLGQHDGAGDWYDRWRTLPDGERNPLRTYTVRRIDPGARRLDVDFVVHHDAGPAGAWADSVAPGARVVVIGPDERSPHARTGLDWHPGVARRLLIAGDETAAPAICGILESLGQLGQAAADVDAFIEVPTSADELSPRLPAGARVSWIARGDAPHGDRLIAAVTDWTIANASVLARAAAPRAQTLDDIDVDLDLLWDSPEEDGDGEFYAWMAGEASTVKTLRRLLVSGCGVDRKRVAFMGYWRLGQAERTG